MPPGRCELALVGWQERSSRISPSVGGSRLRSQARHGAPPTARPPSSHNANCGVSAKHLGSSDSAVHIPNCRHDGCFGKT
jgi:hypothetical protein